MTFNRLKVSHRLTLCSGLVAVLLVSSDSFMRLANASSNAGTAANLKTENEVTPDNSEMNRRERSKQELSADSQSNTKTDLEITRAIRQSLTRDSNLSTYGHNVKIITQDGKVTLKGPIRSDEERLIITEKAKKVAGPKNVQDQLEVADNS